MEKISPANSLSLSSNAPVIHNFEEFYKFVYQLANQIPKRDKFGIWTTVEKTSLETFALLIEASFSARAAKLDPLARARTKIEIIKRLIRTAHQLKIIQDKPYLELETRLIGISKEVGGWIKYVS